jgi:hypothetical protein
MQHKSEEGKRVVCGDQLSTQPTGKMEKIPFLIDIEK